VIQSGAQNGAGARWFLARALPGGKIQRHAIDDRDRGSNLRAGYSNKPRKAGDHVAQARSRRLRQLKSATVSATHSGSSPGFEHPRHFADDPWANAEAMGELEFLAVALSRRPSIGDELLLEPPPGERGLLERPAGIANRMGEEVREAGKLGR
jgi:hypothetical protein